MDYKDIKDLINSTLQGKNDGHEITPLEHQNMILAVLEYAHNIEIDGQSVLLGFADSYMVPEMPKDKMVCYISLCQSGTLTVFNSFVGQDGDSLFVECDSNEVKFVVFLWNKKYWEKIEQSLTI